MVFTFCSPGFSIGYDYYAPQRSVCFHHYASQDKTHKRDKVPKFWVRYVKFSLYFFTLLVLSDTYVYFLNTFNRKTIKGTQV